MVHYGLAPSGRSRAFPVKRVSWGKRGTVRLPHRRGFAVGAMCSAVAAPATSGNYGAAVFFFFSVCF